MENEFFIALEAHNPERNCHRRYEVSIDRDLLGDFVVTVRYGRVGTGGRDLKVAARTADELSEIVQNCLRRRRSARRRLGCDYRAVALRAAAGGEASALLKEETLLRVWSE